MSLLVNILRKLLPKYFSPFRGPICSWDDGLNNSNGYESDDFFKKALNSAKLVSEINTIYERDSVIFRDKLINEFIMFWLFYQKACQKENLIILDFGGGYGSTFNQNKRFLNELDNYKWIVLEQPRVVNECLNIFNLPGLFFVKNIEDAIKINKDINVLIISSSIQYIKNIDQQLLELLNLKTNIIILDRIPFHFYEKNENIILCQKVDSTIYDTSYPFWVQSFFNFKQLLNKHGYCMIYDKISQEAAKITNSNFQFEYHSLVFKISK